MDVNGIIAKIKQKYSVTSMCMIVVALLLSFRIGMFFSETIHKINEDVNITPQLVKTIKVGDKPIPDIHRIYRTVIGGDVVYYAVVEEGAR